MSKENYKLPPEGSLADTYLHQVAFMAIKSLQLIPSDVAARYPELPYPKRALDALKNTALPSRLMQLAELGYIDIARAICKRAEQEAFEQYGIEYKEEEP